MRELSRLIGLQVIATNEGKKLGSVADAYVDLAAGELVCVTLARTPELRVILADDIDVIGDDAIMVSDREKLHGRDDVEEELERGKRVLSSPPTVLTSQGKTLGELGTIQIDEGTKKVIRFEVTGGPLKDVTEGVLALPILDGIVHGEDTLIVPHEVVARRLIQSGGLRGALRNLGERLRVSVEDISERSGEFVRDSEEKLKKRAEEARKKAEEASEKAKEAVGEVADEARESLEEARESLEGEDEPETPEAPDAEPDAPRMEDPEADAEAEVEASGDVGPAGDLVPGGSTPLPAGADDMSDDADNTPEDAADEPSQEADEEGDEETE